MAKLSKNSLVQGVLLNPVVIVYTVVGLVILIVAVRIMRKPKRKAKEEEEKMKREAERMEKELKFIEEKEQKVYDQAAATFALTVNSVRICDQVALAVAGAFGRGILGNDEEEIMVKQINRLAGPKTIQCADYFYKKYSHKNNPNIAYDVINTLNPLEWNQLKEDLKAPLMAYARLKGEPKVDWYF